MLRYLILFVCGLTLLASCGGGGGDMSVTSLVCKTSNCSTTGPEVQLPYAFFQQLNNLPVVVDGGPNTSSFGGNANMLYATVTVCAPGDPTKCQAIDHVLVDTGSFGLRILASKVSGLVLPSVKLSPNAQAPAPVWECLQFVIGGLWGATVQADVGLGQQWAANIPVQLIQDDPSAPIQATADCLTGSNNQVLSSASQLGANGILGIGSVDVDCGGQCVVGDYSSGFVRYYSCPQGALSSSACTPTPVPLNFQVKNPVYALPNGYNNGVVLALPSVTGLGAGVVHGELILGVDSLPNNTLGSSATRINLGTNPNSASYLSITTQFGGKTYSDSYLDTGTNGLFFDSPTTIDKCLPWYCPKSQLSFVASLSDGDNFLQNQVAVPFNVGTGITLPTYYAFGDLAGPQPTNAVTPSTPFSTFAWGLPFFYGRRVALSIWDLSPGSTGPWYSWSSL